MSYQLPQGTSTTAGTTSSSRSNNDDGSHHGTSAGAAAGGKANSNPTSIDAMFQGILPGSMGSMSPSNPRQHMTGLSNFGGGHHLNHPMMNMGGMNMGGMNTSSMHQGSGMAGMGGGDFSSLLWSPAGTPSTNSRSRMSALNNADELGDEIQRLQQLHHLATSGGGAGNNGSSSGAGGNLQDLLGASGAMANFSSQQQQQQRDAAVSSYLLQQQQQQQAALQQQQQQQVFQQHFGGGTGADSVGRQLLMSRAAMAIGGPGGQSMALPSPSMLSARAAAAAMAAGRPGPGPGAIEPFPEKLHRMLTEVEACGKAHIISFVDEGRAFGIHKPNQFFKEIVPLYFRQSRLSSFKRQLNLYGFELISNGPFRGAYFHDLFQRDRPAMCRRMRRVAVKVAAKKQQEEDEGPEDSGKNKTNASDSNNNDAAGANDEE